MDRQAALEMFHANRPLVGWVLGRYDWQGRAKGVPREDLEAAADWGLWRACVTYEPTRGKFSGYAVPVITNAIRMEIRRWRNGGWREHVVQSLDAVVYESDREDHDITFGDVLGVEDDDSHLDVRRFVSRLPERDRMIVLLLTGGLSQREISRRIGTPLSVVNRRVQHIRSEAERYLEAR